ncbi:MAG TPA: YrdB family protein [Phototrophicaceae bacterium]|jgi:hypothetical protein|nr:YrdB family protein [Phototrophicaceae bacterium]
MSKNPMVLLVTFLLELAGVFAQGYWGWTTQEGLWRPILGLGIPLITATIWGIFRVPGEPGDAPVRVSGPVRLMIEAAFFGLAVLLLAAAGQSNAAIVLGGIVVVTYLASYDRIIRFMKLG